MERNAEIMNTREFDLLISLILSMLKKGETDEVIRILSEFCNKDVPKE